MSSNPLKSIQIHSNPLKTTQSSQIDTSLITRQGFSTKLGLLPKLISIQMSSSARQVFHNFEYATFSILLINSNKVTQVGNPIYVFSSSKEYLDCLGVFPNTLQILELDLSSWNQIAAESGLEVFILHSETFETLTHFVLLSGSIV